MSVINFNGLISPTFFTSFQTIKVAGAHATADDKYDYYVANEAIFEFRLEVQTPSGVVVIERHASAKDPLYDKTRPCYICDPTPAATLEKLVDAVQGNQLAKGTIRSLKMWVKPFFLETLRLLTRTGSDTFTLARPNASSKADVEGSFNHQFKDDVGIVSHPKDIVKEIKEIPCDLSGVTVLPPVTPGDPPRVALSVIMRIKDRLPPGDRDEVARLLIAADYTKIYKHAKTKGRQPWFQGNPAVGIEIELRQWEKNLAHYLWNHTDLKRGETIFKEIVAAGVTAAAAGKSTIEIVKIVRDEIDARLITANHWGQRREDRFKETYQRKLSDVYGAIHGAQFFMASPVAWLRNLGDEAQQRLLDAAPNTAYTPGERLVVSLQWGVGHCQEHANVSFQVLAAIMNAGHSSKFGLIVLSGNANIDHAFVVGGFKSPDVFITRLSKDFYVGAKDEDIGIFNLRDALADSKGQAGFVCDPYLDSSAQAITCKGLLAKINDSDHASRLLADKKTFADIRTDFLRHADEHPARPAGPPPVKVLGQRGL